MGILHVMSNSCPAPHKSGAAVKCETSVRIKSCVNDSFFGREKRLVSRQVLQRQKTRSIREVITHRAIRPMATIRHYVLQSIGKNRCHGPD